MIARLLFVLILALAPAAFAEPLRTAHVEMELGSARAAIAPGERFTVVLRQHIAPGWHTYWRNPGDSGEPTRVTWHLPRGFTAGPMRWPAPEPLLFVVPPVRLVNYGYSGEVLYPIEISAPRTLPIGTSVTLSADVTWLVCSSDLCVPEQGNVSLVLPVAAQGRDDPTWSSRAPAAITALPRPGPQAHITSGDPATLSIALQNASAISDPYFFPYSAGAIDHDAPQDARVGTGGVSFTLKHGADNNLGATQLEGVLTLRDQTGATRAFEIRATPGAVLLHTADAAAHVSRDFPIQPDARVQANAGSASGVTPSLGLALAFAFLGGLILNVMPCVLPILSMKALALAGGAHAGQARRQGLLYAAGVLVSFVALAALLIVLRGAGEAIGWGFQLQLPWVSAGIALLFFAIGLNLLGVYEIGGPQNAGASLAARGGDIGAFFTGALAVVAATPCTAPFMAGAIGAALAQSNATTLLIFAALGLGFAAPLTALSFAPGLQRIIPKPGAWMNRVRSVLAFLMFGSAVWLAWVLTEQTGAAGALALLALATALAFALVVARWGRLWLAVGLIVLALTGALAWRPLFGQQAAEAIASEPWSEARVATLRAEGRPVFVNFTAAWCITCQLNEAAALSQQDVTTAFTRNHVAYLKADWTNRDPAIAAALARFGRAGVPLYLYYAPGREARILPQLLSAQAVTDAVEGK